jgi:hypothetical protein
VAFYDQWAREQAAVEGDMAAAYSKLEAYAVRFALLHHDISHVARGEDDRVLVEAESLQAGAVLCRWFAGEARRIYATLSESTEQRDTRKLVEFIQARGGCISTRQLQKSNSRKYRSSEEAETALEALVRAGWADWVEGEAPSRGGHQARFVELLPTHDTSDTREDDGEVDDEAEADT